MSFSRTTRNGIAVSITRTFYAVSLCALALLPATMALAQDSSAAQEVSVPNTTSYLLLGLAVVALILGIWAARMIVRFRTLRQDEATLEALDEAEPGADR